MNRLHSFGATAVVLVASLALPRPALADVPPPTACEGANVQAGQSCTTAGDGTEDGVCVEETCTSGNPFLDSGPKTYPCLLCELVDGGSQPTDAGPAPTDASSPVDAASADAGSGTGAGSPATDAGAPSTDAGSDQTALASSSSCAVAFAGGTTQSPAPAWLFGVGAVGMVASLARRRRRANRSR